MKTKSFWNPQPIKIGQFPKRTTKENRLIDKNPWGDTDKDGVPNMFDCKPLNKKKQDWLQSAFSGASQVPLKMAQLQSQSQRTFSQANVLNAAAANAAIRNPTQAVQIRPPNM